MGSDEPRPVQPVRAPLIWHDRLLKALSVVIAPGGAHHEEDGHGNTITPERGGRNSYTRQIAPICEHLPHTIRHFTVRDDLQSVLLVDTLCRL